MSTQQEVCAWWAFLEILRSWEDTWTCHGQPGSSTWGPTRPHCAAVKRCVVSSICELVDWKDGYRSRLGKRAGASEKPKEE